MNKEIETVSLEAEEKPKLNLEKEFLKFRKRVLMGEFMIVVVIILLTVAILLLGGLL